MRQPALLLKLPTRLELPTEPGEAQRMCGIELEGSFGLSVKVKPGQACCEHSWCELVLDKMIAGRSMTGSTAGLGANSQFSSLNASEPQ